jgi:glycolate oxidase FAD binding subunit
MASAQPPSLLALQERVCAAIAHATSTDGTRPSHQPLRIRGGRSKAFLRCNDDDSGAPAPEPLDTRAHSGIVAYDPSELVVTVRAGTPLAELEATLAERGQYLAFEPPHFQLGGADGGTAGGTVGGMVAAGLGGPARACVGGVRDYVLGLQMVNGRGEIVRFGGTVMKNVAGYDVSRLMVGSWGSLGLITEVSLKVLPHPPAQATLRFWMDQANMLRQLNTWMGQPLPLNASSWVDGRANGVASGGDGQDTLYLRLRGAQVAVESACAMLQRQHGAQRVDSPQTAADWTAARDLRLPFFTQTPPGHNLWRLSLPPTAPALPLPQPQLIEWMGGLRWLWMPVEDNNLIEEYAYKMNIHSAIFIAASGINVKKKLSIHIQKQQATRFPSQLTIQQRLKAAFDPHGVFAHGAGPFGI